MIPKRSETFRQARLDIRGRDLELWEESVEKVVYAETKAML